MWPYNGRVCGGGGGGLRTNNSLGGGGANPPLARRAAAYMYALDALRNKKKGGGMKSVPFGKDQRRSRMYRPGQIQEFRKGGEGLVSSIILI